MRFGSTLITLSLISVVYAFPANGIFTNDVFFKNLAQTTHYKNSILICLDLSARAKQDADLLNGGGNGGFGLLNEEKRGGIYI